MRSVKVVQGRPSLWCAVKLRATLGVRGSTEETKDNGCLRTIFPPLPNAPGSTIQLFTTSVDISFNYSTHWLISHSTIRHID